MTGKIEKWAESANKTLHEKNFFTDLLAKVEEKTKISRLKLVIGSVVVIGLYMMVGYGSDFICNVIGFAYPAYKSIKAIETKQKDDDTKWLTYWVVYAFFLLIEYFTDLLLSWVPIYWFIKCVFLIYCMLPEPYSGSLMIYSAIIRPTFLKHQAKIDRGVEKATAIGSAVIEEAKNVVEETVTDVLKTKLPSEGTSDQRMESNKQD